MNTGKPLTADQERVIIAALSKGAFLADAFAICEIPERQWKRWMDPSLKRGKYAQFQLRIKKAQSFARFKAAEQIFASDPFKWAANGPGRETKDAQGFAAMPEIYIHPDEGQVDPLAIPEFVKFCRIVHETLALYPDAREEFERRMNAENREPIQILAPDT